MRKSLQGPHDENVLLPNMATFANICFWNQRCLLTWSQIFCYLPSCPPAWECSTADFPKLQLPEGVQGPSGVLLSPTILCAKWNQFHRCWQSQSMLSSSNKIPFQYFARTLPNIKTGHDWHWNVEGHHTAQDWHELVCFDELDEAHPFVQIRFALNVGPGVDGGHPDDLATGKLPLKKMQKQNKLNWPWKVPRRRGSSEPLSSSFFEPGKREGVWQRSTLKIISRDASWLFLHLSLVVVTPAVVSVTIF